MRNLTVSFPDGSEEKIEVYHKGDQTFVKFLNEEILCKPGQAKFHQNKIYICNESFQGCLEVRETNLGGEQESSANTDLKAKFPGKVTKIFVQLGNVKKGDTLLS